MKQYYTLVGPQILNLLFSSSIHNLDSHFVQTAICIIQMMLEKKRDLVWIHILYPLLQPIMEIWDKEVFDKTDSQDILLSEEVKFLEIVFESYKAVERVVDGLYRLTCGQCHPILAESLKHALGIEKSGLKRFIIKVPLHLYFSVILKTVGCGVCILFRKDQL
mgnify:CR=1 FL=1